MAGCYGRERKRDRDRNIVVGRRVCVGVGWSLIVHNKKKKGPLKEKEKNAHRLLSFSQEHCMKEKKRRKKKTWTFTRKWFCFSPWIKKNGEKGSREEGRVSQEKKKERIRNGGKGKRGQKGAATTEVDEEVIWWWWLNANPSLSLSLWLSSQLLERRRK